MEIVAASPLQAVKIVTPKVHQDERGFFCETWREDRLQDAGLGARFVQDNHALSRARGTIRGLHFQIGAAAQGKLVRCVAGSILDVAVDIRRGSPTYGRHVTAVLSKANWQQIYVPAGFAHAYCTLEPDTEVIYKVTTYYDAAAERGIIWDDPAIAIAWPISRDQVLVSDKDRMLPRLADLPPYFDLASCAG